MPKYTALTWRQRFGAFCGVTAPIVGFVFILSAIASYPTFSWTNNALSDLGVVNGVTGPLFNFGLIAAGLLSLNFAALGLFIYFKRAVGKIGAIFFAAGSVALVAIGVFNESFSPTHYIVSVAFFTLMPIAMFIFTCTFALVHQARMAVFTLLIGLAAAVPWILQLTLKYVPNVAIPEASSGMLISAWTIVLSYKILKNQVSPKNP